MAEKKIKKVKRTQQIPRRVNVYSLDGEIKREVELPAAFVTEYRPDVIGRASVSIIANRRQPYAPKATAGMRHSVSTWGKGHGVSRVQRLKQGATAAQSPNNVTGRRAHPPKVDKDLKKRMNRKEMRYARLSALAATANPARVGMRGHKIPEELTVPVILENELENIASTKEAVALLERIGLSDELERARQGRRIRAGRGKMRGRKYRNRRSVLVVISENCSARRSFANITGVDVSTVDSLNVETLAPGGMAGRLTIMSESALSKIGEWAS